jgi:hypothetical protein
MNMKNVFAASLIAGLIASSAMAQEQGAQQPADDHPAAAQADKDGCGGKDGCKGKAPHHAKKKKHEKKHAEEKKQ